jgi:hypothetical protein
MGVLSAFTGGRFSVIFAPQGSFDNSIPSTKVLSAQVQTQEEPAGFEVDDQRNI